MEKKPSRARELIRRIEALELCELLDAPEEDKAALSVFYRQARMGLRKCDRVCNWEAETSSGWSKDITPDMELAFNAGRAYEQLIQAEGA